MVPYERIGLKNDYPPLHEASEIDLHPSFLKQKIKQLHNINSEYIRTKGSVIPPNQPTLPNSHKKIHSLRGLVAVASCSCSLARNFIQLHAETIVATVLCKVIVFPPHYSYINYICFPVHLSTLPLRTIQFLLTLTAKLGYGHRSNWLKIKGRPPTLLPKKTVPFRRD
jgi:hypothetical protein